MATNKLKQKRILVRGIAEMSSSHSTTLHKIKINMSTAGTDTPFKSISTAKKACKPERILIGDIGLASTATPVSSESGEIVPNGVYSSVTPDGESTNRLLKLYGLVSFIPSEKEPKFHCTVLYSRNKNLVTKQPEFDPEHVCSATIKEFKVWKGHDDKEYLVATLESDILHALNAQWTKLGYTTDFPEYVPHVTLKTGIEDAETGERALRVLNEFIATSPDYMNLTFSNQVVEPLRD